MNSTQQAKPRGFIESSIALGLLFLLLFDLYVVLRTFFGVFTYAIIFAVAFSPLFERLTGLLGSKRKLAAFIYALILIAIIAVPFAYILMALSDYATSAQQWLVDAKEKGVPDLPEWARQVPFAGSKISAFWDQLQSDPKGTISAYEPKLRQVIQQLVSGGAGMVGAVLELIVGIIISAIFLVSGSKILRPLYSIMGRIVGEDQAPLLIDATGRAVNGVAVGVMGTALIAAVAAWIGFAIAGISFAVGLAALTFFLVVIQLGPVLVFVPVAIWLGTSGQSGMATFITIYGIVVLMGIDNILKPILIARSGKLPILVLFLGVIGGMITWGFTGMFKGAIILAVFYTIIQFWLAQKDTPVISESPSVTPV